MKILAVDTSSGPGSLALASDDGWQQVVPLSAEWKSTTLHTEIARLLESHGWKSVDVESYAVASGPGTFTGLRIGLTAVKALAEVHHRPIVTVSTLEVLARAGRDCLPATYAGGLVPLLDARRGQVFGAVYRCGEEAMEPVVPDFVGSLKHFLARVRTADVGNVRFCATELDLFSEEILAAGWDDSCQLAVAPSLAGTLVRMGLERLQQGRACSAEAAEANYVRASDAELFWTG